MPYYAIPIGLGVEEIGFGFNREVITGRLRGRFGYDGVVCTDWGLVTDVRVEGVRWPARCWGAEHLSRIERVRRIIDAGVDQLGGESCPELIVELVSSGAIPVSRIDASARRILRLKFSLGLFDNPCVDPDEAERVVGNPEFAAAGVRAQQRAVTLLKNGPLPLPRGARMLLDGVDPAVAARYGQVVSRPADADVAVVRLPAPYEHRDTGVDYEAGFHQGRLDLPPDRVEELVHRFGEVPTVLVVHLDRAAVLPEVIAASAAALGEFGATDAALLPLLFGEVAPQGRLPMELPSSMAAVEASREDVPGDTENPLFPAGHGLTY